MQGNLPATFRDRRVAQGSRAAQHPPRHEIGVRTAKVVHFALQLPLSANLGVWLDANQTESHRHGAKHHPVFCRSDQNAVAFATRDKRPVSIGFAGLALFVRELAMPYVLLALCFACWHRRWREAAAWLILIAAFGAAMVLHANAALAQPIGQTSPGWLTVRGPLAVFQGLSEMPPFIFVGVTLTPVLALLALFGWTRAPGEQGLFGASLMTGFLCAFAVLGRSDNTYWTVLLLPTLLLGLAFLIGIPRGRRFAA